VDIGWINQPRLIVGKGIHKTLPFEIDWVRAVSSNGGASPHGERADLC